eukprot:PLAT4750.1.p1 GENE.PLAT4750.1~~PLAT4750.1.p1  ORF type:complete len:272 (+),score=70.20 PLAT4750.1:39-854(+)
MLLRPGRALASARASVWRASGVFGSLQWRAHLEDGEGKPVSAIHDIPLESEAAVSDGTPPSRLLHAVIEVPRGTSAKMEVLDDEDWNPLAQDSTKDGRPRFYGRPSAVNYGFLPQTWEDPRPAARHEATGALGDGDPLDICELGSLQTQRGELLDVKLLGALALLDEGELDWKLLVLNVNDPLAPFIHDIDDLQRHMPGRVDAVRHWFRVYKTSDGKPENEYAFEGRALGASEAEEVVAGCHRHWQSWMEHAFPPDGKAPAGKPVPPPPKE